MNQRNFQHALQTISERRMHAQMEQEQHYQEVNQKIPQIAEINHQLAQTAFRILNGENIEKMKRQNMDAQQYCARLLVNHGYPADYLDIHYTCKKCSDTGYVNGKMCDCLEKAIASASVSDMHQIAQLKLSDFAHFSLEYYRGITETDEESGKVTDCYTVMHDVLQNCKRYATNFNLHSPSLLFYGLAGTGKTHLSLSIVTDVLKQGYEVIYDSVSNLLSKVEREHFSREPSSNTLDILLHVDLLVIDDLGTEFQTAFNRSVIYTIINTRINYGLPTIINTNLTLKDIRIQYEERIVSRLFAVYEDIHFIGEDIRLLKKQNSQPLF